jgi:formylmethanofuran dehydrogenase subunit D
MLSTKLILIAGRSLKQGTGVNAGKGSAEYREAVTTLEMNQADMTRLELRDGDTVKIKTSAGEATARCQSTDLPEGMVFIAYGPVSSQLMGTETDASGMPNSKGFEVEVERAG